MRAPPTTTGRCQTKQNVTVSANSRRSGRSANRGPSAVSILRGPGQQTPAGKGRPRCKIFNLSWLDISVVPQQRNRQAGYRTRFRRACCYAKAIMPRKEELERKSGPSENSDRAPLARAERRTPQTCHDTAGLQPHHAGRPFWSMTMSSVVVAARCRVAPRVRDRRLAASQDSSIGRLRVWRWWLSSSS